jgi:hypothetical protein
MLPRAAAPALRRLARQYPVLAITGPRQSGKTTLARAAFARKPYASLEDLDTREFAERDPRGFLAQYRSGAVIDEAQRAPALFSYLQTVVDADRRPGRFVLTGSQQFGLLTGITQSLAGRVGLLELLPFSLDELGAVHAPRSPEEVLWRGLYPPVIDRGVPPPGWYRNYVATYIERDLRLLVNIRDLGPFRRFVRMCAARTAQTLNLSALAADCGITHNTARAWLSVLEASYVVHLVVPYHRNFGKRLVKAPKLYFIDPGLAASLLGVERAHELATHAMRGPLFETWAVAELLKHQLNRGKPAGLHFWRDSHGVEIDIVVERAGRLRALEIKAGRTVAGDWFNAFSRVPADAAVVPALLYAGEQGQARQHCPVYGWREIGSAARRLFGS